MEENIEKELIELIEEYQQKSQETLRKLDAVKMALDEVSAMIKAGVK